ncbi:PIN domain-containing protein [Algiphilus sp.]|uniref:PIN domain-containing protein n=1 Tax=Algiphilus sp. TaxID=1872431 RepID=UPI0025BB6CA6|nr:PIN domain-containing protein [Abyssibacter sp.]MCK5857875.1 PIN domain-containing protein [Abyssibacter sp.]
MTEIRVALDTNVLVYAEGGGDDARCASARHLVGALRGCEIMLPAQVLGELYRVLNGKQGRPPTETRAAVMEWSDAFAVIDSNAAAFSSAMDCAVSHGLQIRDALILSVAGQAGCRYLLSEDLQAGFVWHGVSVVNPFQQPWPPSLQAALT